MAFNNLQINVRSGGLSRQATGEDHISAILFSGAAPAGFDGAKAVEVRSLREAESKGVVGTGALVLEHYHVSEFFRMAPGATLWVCFGLVDVPGELRALTGGKLRQWATTVIDTSTVQATYQGYVTAMADKACPTVCVLGIAGENATALAALPNLDTLVAPQVAIVACGSGTGKAEAVRASLGLTYVPAVGTTLGTIAAAPVHHSIGFVDRYNLSDGSEFESVRFCDGNIDAIGAAADALGAKQYLVVGRYDDYPGAYFDDDSTAKVETDDYSTIHANRVIQKAIRLVRRALLPQVNSPQLVDPDTGKLAATTVASMEGIASASLNPMAGDREVSGFAVSVDPEQDVNSTSLVDVEVEVTPVGVAKTLRVSIGLATRIN